MIMETEFDNPFVVSGYACPEYFCDRVKEADNVFRPFVRSAKDIR